MFFKEKEPEPINNHVVRTIIEAKYTLKDLSLEEVTILRNLLSDRERKIVDMYFGVDGGALTLEQIGDEFGLTKERIRQIKEKALRKLKNNSENLFEFVQK